MCTHSKPTDSAEGQEFMSCLVSVGVSRKILLRTIHTGPPQRDYHKENVVSPSLPYAVWPWDPLNLEICLFKIRYYSESVSLRSVIIFAH